MVKRTLWLAIFTCGLLLLSVSCSRAPSEHVIKAAITKYMQNEFPESQSGIFRKYKNVRIELIEIKQTGIFNDRKRYWPVRARVKGTIQVIMLFTTETKAFDEVDDFRLYKDDYGNWRASLAKR